MATTYASPLTGIFSSSSPPRPITQTQRKRAEWLKALAYAGVLGVGFYNTVYSTSKEMWKRAAPFVGSAALIGILEYADRSHCATVVPNPPAATRGTV